MAELSRDELCEAELTSFGWASFLAQQEMSSAVPTSDDHNFLVRSLFHVFVDSMEIPLSLESIHIWCNII